MGEAGFAGDGVEQLDIADGERFTATLSDGEQSPRPDLVRQDGDRCGVVGQWGPTYVVGEQKCPAATV